jgi:hypothetical protein
LEPTSRSGDAGYCDHDPVPAEGPASPERDAGYFFSQPRAVCCQ